MKAISRSLSLLTLMTGLILIACSGGGGGSTPPPPPPPAGLSGFTATPRDGYVLLSGTPASGVTGVNLYWSTASGVSTTSGTKIIVGTGDAQAHTGAANGTTYYYVATTISGGVESLASAQVSAKPVAVAAGLPDPLYSEQWHLKSTGTQAGATTTALLGEDLNVEPVWATNKGSGIRIAVVDDGLEIAHEDLATNVEANDLSYNYVTGSNDPTNSPTDTSEGNGHGTAVAGIIAARDSNGLGVSGVAPRAKLVGYNYLLSGTAANQADAMSRGIAAVHISSNSWGAGGAKTGNLTIAPTLWRSAIDTGLASGRSGKGTVYVFSAGNGAPQDNANYHGLKNSHGIVAVAAVNDQGTKASYSEEGANLWVSSPGGEFCTTHTITTTDRTGDRGFNLNVNATTTDYVNKAYTRCMNGTSAAAPGVSGVVALMLAANPNLGWRDVKLILAESARKNDAADAGWFLTGGSKKYHFNHKYGFGVANAAAAVALATSWTNVAAETTQSSATASPNIAIPDGTGVSVTSTINVASGSVTSIEFMEITFSAADHTYMGDLEVTLTSPSGTVSRLAETHGCFDAAGAQLMQCPTFYNNWIFGSSVHLGESPVGNWILTVTDRGPGDAGHLQSWGMKFYGR